MWAPGVRDPSSLHCGKPHPLEQQRSSPSSQSRLPCEESNFGLHSQAHHLARSQEGQWLPRLWPLVSSPGTEVLHRQNHSLQRGGRLFVPHCQQTDQNCLRADDVQMDRIRHQREHLGRGSQADGPQNQKGCSIQDITEAQGWSSPTTFQNVYLKDVLIVLVPTATRVLSTAGSSSTMVRR